MGKAQWNKEVNSLVFAALYYALGADCDDSKWEVVWDLKDDFISISRLDDNGNWLEEYAIKIERVK